MLAGHVAAGVAAAQPANANVHGKVADEGGKPVAAARISYQRLPLTVKNGQGRWEEAPGEAHVNAQTGGDAGGGYSIPQLPAGNYILCVSAPGYLASCEWSAWHRLTIADGQVLDFGTLALAKAAVVTIRVDDPMLLMQSTGKVAPPLVVGVQDQSNRFHAARQTSADSSGRVFQVDVPYDKPLRFWVQSWKFRITDSSGAPLNNFGALIPFQAEQNSALPQFRIRIVGTL